MNYLAIAAAISGFIVFGAGLIATIGWSDYQTDRDNHRNSTTVTNDHVTNLPWSLLSEDKK